MLNHAYKLTPEQEVKVIRWYTGDTRSGTCYSQQWIANKLHVTRPTVQRILQRHSIDIRGKGRPTRDDGLRRCALCGVERVLDDFARDASKPLGRAYYCKSCNAIKSDVVSSDPSIIHEDDDD